MCICCMCVMSWTITATAQAIEASFVCALLSTVYVHAMKGCTCATCAMVC
jgi:hypothetical protein